MTSLWLDRPEPIADEPLPQGDVLDDIVVGGGITGLTTALLLARSGRRVAVLEARTVGAGTTGNTTGKVSLLQGTKLSRMRGFQSMKVLRAYLDGQREGQAWLLRFCTDHGVPFQVRDAITYASSPEQAESLNAEHEVARELGLDVRLSADLDVPFPQFGGVILADQAQIDSMDVLSALVDQVRGHGGSVHQGHRVTGVSRRGRPTVTLDGGEQLLADNVVIATGSPILDRSLYFAKLEPLRSYALAFEVEPGSVPTGMYLSAGEPSRSIRTAGHAGEPDRLVIGGEGHVVGRTSSELEHVDILREWTARYFPGAVETHRWSAQDYRSHDSFPYVGALPRGGGRIFVGTGFDKWGMTGGVAAARSIAGQILGSTPGWQETQSRRVTRPSGVAQVAKLNAGVVASLVRRGVSTVLPGADQVKHNPAAPDTGEVGMRGVIPTATSTVDGRTCSVSAICTHLGGVLAWNDAERSWDCPLHGSRFSADGTVLEGPATKPLKKLPQDVGDSESPPHGN